MWLGVTYLDSHNGVVVGEGRRHSGTIPRKGDFVAFDEGGPHEVVQVVWLVDYDGVNIMLRRNLTRSGN